MNLLETNIYDVKGKILICGTCLPRMQKDGFKKLEKGFDTILYLCLEKEHINMAITKICGMIATKKIESLTFASVNKSLHCIQLHYIKHEIERVMKDIPQIENIIIEDNKIYKISDETISLSKNLVKLEKINI